MTPAHRCITIYRYLDIGLKSSIRSRRSRQSQGYSLNHRPLQKKKIVFNMILLKKGKFIKLTIIIYVDYNAWTSSITIYNYNETNVNNIINDIIMINIIKVKHTAFSKCVWARSMFFVWALKTRPSWRCVLASIRGGGLKLKIVCKQWMHNLILGGLEILKFSARPNNPKYQLSECEDAILLSSRWWIAIQH